MDLGLKGKNALVCGASRGLGRAIVLAFADRGADVALGARSRRDLEAVAREAEARGRRTVAQPTDVRDLDQLRALADAAVARFGRIIAGGGWDEPSYAFMSEAFASPWDRWPTNGLRLVTFLKAEPLLERAREPLVRTIRDYSKEKPAGDTEFRIYRRLYDYDRRPLHEVVQSNLFQTK